MIDPNLIVGIIIGAVFCTPIGYLIADNKNLRTQVDKK